ncbi:tumor protein p63-regulated gene 1 protein isoform X2 [Bubalus kerabau]|nr:tumor protein p63-regulated gene 1 protein isoform X2 [Bubalus carabanensis]XP_055424706.1 tumor protein p63-regulated gene 1 protein isoform X2 [Bubalus carabanensis]
MSRIGSSEGFQPVSLKREEDDQPSETDQLSMEEREPETEVPVPKQISRLPSVVESALYPNPYHKPYLSRKYFVTRPGVIETAMEDLKGHITKTSGETIQGFWLLTEIDHWNNEKERILLITDKTLLICKYDFIMLCCVQLQWIPLSAIYRICLGKFSFPAMSLDKPHTSFPADYEQPKAEDFPGLSAVNATEAIFGPTELKVGLKLNIQKTRIMASSPITSWKIDGETVETVTDFIMLGFKISADGDCSHEIKRHLLLGRKAMTNLDSILKSRDITLLTKVHLVKAMDFSVVMYGCESWTVKKAECQRIDAFELWCWRRLLRVPWTARRSNQSILKEISPEYSLEGQMLKLKLQYFSHLMQRSDSFEKTLMLGKIEGRRRRGQQRMRWLDGINNSTGMSWSRLQELVIGKTGMLQSMRLQRVRHD